MITVDVWMAGPAFPEKGDTVHVRHPDITEDEIEVLPGNPGQGIPTINGSYYGIAMTTHHGLQHVTHILLVIDDK